MVAPAEASWASFSVAPSGSAPTLTLKAPKEALLPRLVASLCISSGGIAAECLLLEDLGAGEEASVSADVSGGTITGDVAAARCIAAAAAPEAAGRLLGSDAAARAQVGQWVSGVGSGLGTLSSPGLARLRLLNSLLTSRPALVSRAADVTLADIAVYCSILEDVRCLPLFDRLAMPNLMRWIDLVQTATRAADVVPSAIPVKPAPFEPPPLGK